MAGRRISVEHVMLCHEHSGMSPEEIAVDYDLSLAKVYAVLAYYFNHKEEIRARYEQGFKMVEQFMAENPSVLQQRAEALRRTQGD